MAASTARPEESKYLNSVSMYSEECGADISTSVKKRSHTPAPTASAGTCCVYTLQKNNRCVVDMTVHLMAAIDDSCQGAMPLRQVTL